MVIGYLTRFRTSSIAAKAMIASAAVAAFAVASAQASLVVYEPYNYGLAQGTQMAGVTANATGLTGSYINVNVINKPAVNITTTYNTTSLPLANLQETGGSIYQPNDGKSLIEAQLDPTASAAFSSGNTLYGSYVFNIGADYGINGGQSNGAGSPGTGLVSGLMIGSEDSADNSSVINISPISYGQNFGQIKANGGYAAGNAAAGTTSGPIVAGQNYIELFQISYGSGNTVSAAEATLSASQFQNFENNLTFSALEAASLGTGSNQVTELASFTDQAGNGTTLSAANANNYMKFL